VNKGNKGGNKPSDAALEAEQILRDDRIAREEPEA